MPISLSKIINDSASVSFQYGEDTVNLEYYPGRITERTFAQLNSFSHIEVADDAIGAFATLNSLLAGEGEDAKLGILKSWDVLEDDGAMFPIMPDRLSGLPIPFRLAVLQAVIGDMRPNLLPQGS